MKTTDGPPIMLFGLTMMEMARVDASLAPFFGVHTRLAMQNLIVGKAITGFSAFI
ncbi:hypothetical protein AB4Y45_18140 [Paraburkholderia sp. EG287A]|uniref:hypothetical protein n=1 Tax=unclassified Paraburkholderia TaxID=2615204 RepID=UPI0034D27C42